MNLLTVSIEDDGIGFDQQSAPLHRYGIVIMRDRAQSLAGELKVLPRPGGGTRVQFSFPNQPELQDSPA
jgi:two-component system nitrate/nitrite sensor histidine kinase NarX